MLVKVASSYIRNLPDKIELKIQSRKTKNKSNEENRNVKQESDNKVEAGSSGESSSLDREDIEMFDKLRQVYTMGEEWFGSAFVLQIPTLYIAYHKDVMPTFLSSHIYKELGTTGEELLTNMLNREQNDAIKKDSKNERGDGIFNPAKRARLDLNHPSYDLTSDVDFDSMDFESLIGDTPLPSFKTPPENIFSEDNKFYKRLPSQDSRVITFKLPRCNVWDKSKLRKNKGLMPVVKEHPHRHLLNKYYKSKSPINRMPHCKFSRPLLSKIRPCFSIHDVML